MPVERLGASIIISEDAINSAMESKIIEEKESDFMTTPTDKKNVGLDIGTMNLVCAHAANDQVHTTSYRNVFLKVDKDAMGSYDLDLIAHTFIDDTLYILAEDAYKFANMFNLQLSRPMEKGLISSSEIDAIDVLTVMVQALIGQGDGGNCCFSIPANPIDSDRNNLFHEGVFTRIVSQLNYNPVPLNEGSAVIYSECEDTEFSGIGISFGDGMTNVSVLYKAVASQNLTFSLARGGGWIDENSAIQSGVVTNKATAIKEREDFDINNFRVGKKREWRIREALSHYYRSLIDYTMKQISNRLSHEDVEFPQEMPIIISGGTSLATGFIDSVSEILQSYDFPFDISEIRYAANPLTAVAEGCLVRSYR